MKLFKDILVCLLLSSVSAFFIYTVVLVADADRAVKAIPAEIKDIKVQVISEVDATRNVLLGLADKHATIVERTVDERLAALQETVDTRSDQTLKLVDTHLSEITQPVVMAQANLYALAKDIQDSLDDLYPDIKGATESATVAITSVAQTSEAIRDAAPKVSASVEGIASDAKREADSITAPKKWWQKVLGPAYTIGRLVALF